MTTEWSLDELYKGFDDPAYGKDVAELMEAAGFSEVQRKKDLSGLDRVVFGKW